MPKIPFKYTLFWDPYKTVISASLSIFLGPIFFAYLSKFLGEIGEDFIFFRLFGIKRTSIVVISSVGIVTAVLVHIGHLSKVSKLPKAQQEKFSNRDHFLMATLLKGGGLSGTEASPLTA